MWRLLVLLTLAAACAAVLGPSSTDARPSKLAVYYGYPSLIDGSAGNLTAAFARYSQYDVIVFAALLETSSHADHDNTKTMIAQLKGNNADVLLFGYIALDHPDGITYLRDHTDLWKAMGVSGIFLDNAGYDFGVTRLHQNDVADYVHSQGLAAFWNPWDPDDVLSPDPDSLYPNANPTAAAHRLRSGDWLLLESYTVSLGNYRSPVAWREKAFKAYNRTLGTGIKVATVTTAGSVGDYDDARWHYAWFATFLWGFESAGWGEFEFAASDNTHPLRPRPAASYVDMGRFNGTAPEENGDRYTRRTTKGVLDLDTSQKLAHFTWTVCPDDCSGHGTCGKRVNVFARNEFFCTCEAQYSGVACQVHTPAAVASDTLSVPIIVAIVLSSTAAVLLSVFLWRSQHSSGYSRMQQIRLHDDPAERLGMHFSRSKARTIKNRGKHSIKPVGPVRKAGEPETGLGGGGTTPWQRRLQPDDSSGGQESEGDDAWDVEQGEEPRQVHLNSPKLRKNNAKLRSRRAIHGRVLAQGRRGKHKVQPHVFASSGVHQNGNTEVVGSVVDDLDASEEVNTMHAGVLRKFVRGIQAAQRIRDNSLAGVSERHGAGGREDPQHRAEFLQQLRENHESERREYESEQSLYSLHSQMRTQAKLKRLLEGARQRMDEQQFDLEVADMLHLLRQEEANRQAQLQKARIKYQTRLQQRLKERRQMRQATKGLPVSQHPTVLNSPRNASTDVFFHGGGVGAAGTSTSTPRKVFSVSTMGADMDPTTPQDHDDRARMLIEQQMLQAQEARNSRRLSMDEEQKVLADRVQERRRQRRLQRQGRRESTSSRASEEEEIL